jgi:hypothetical protein
MQLVLYVPSVFFPIFFSFCGSCVLNLADISPVLKVRFINFERTKLPEEILKHNLDEKRKYFSDVCLEVERSDAEVQVCSLFPSRASLSYIKMAFVFFKSSMWMRYSSLPQICWIICYRAT